MDFVNSYMYIHVHVMYVCYSTIVLACVRVQVHGD